MALQRAQDDDDRDMRLAYVTAKLLRRETLPPLSTLLTRRRSQDRPQSIEEQGAMLAMLAAQYGIPLGKTRLIPKDPKDRPQ